MCNIKEGLLNKIYKQIETKKKILGEGTIHNFDDGTTYLHFFDQWEYIFKGTRGLQLNEFGNFFKNQNFHMIFSEKGSEFPVDIFEVKKTYILIRGKIKFYFKNSKDIIISDLAFTTVPKGVKHGAEILEDSFLMIIDDEYEELPIS